MEVNRRSDKNHRPLKVWLPMIFALVLTFGIVLGLQLSTINQGKKKPFLQRSYNKIDEIMTFVKMRYVDTVNTDKLYESAIQEILAQLDPHSTYIPAADLQHENESLEGNFEGIGIEFHITDDTIVVVTPISGGPSEAAGIKAGDRIVMINDTLVAGIKIKNEDVLKKLRGQKGTKVKVSIVRNGSGKHHQFTITRDKIPLYSVDAAFMIDNEVGYIKISRFSATTYDEFKTKLTALKEKGLKKLVIDVRQNPGGYLNAAVEIADELLDGEKLIVYTKGNSYPRQNYVGTRKGLFENGPLAVLVDQGSASASEILAGAIQDWDRGALIGRNTFGKGLVQEQFSLDDGSALRLTVARYYTPSGRCIQKPYLNGKHAYDEEIINRFEKGALLKEDTVTPKDTVLFRTSKGRVVYAGGGIKPDYFVPIDTAIFNNAYTEALSFIPEFIYKSFTRYESEIKRFSSYRDFYKHYEIPEPVIKNYFDFAQSQGMKSDTNKLLPYLPKIKNRIKAHMARQVWKNEGFYYVMLQDDNELKKALEKL